MIWPVRQFLPFTYNSTFASLFFIASLFLHRIAFFHLVCFLKLLISLKITSAFLCLCSLFSNSKLNNFLLKHHSVSSHYSTLNCKYFHLIIVMLWNLYLYMYVLCVYLCWYLGSVCVYVIVMY